MPTTDFDKAMKYIADLETDRKRLLELEPKYNKLRRGVNDAVAAQNKELIEAAQAAVDAGTHIISVCEMDVEAGRSPNPFIKSSPNAALAECYAATQFVTRLINALPEPLVVSKSNRTKVAG